jgi:hypothetical protein
MGHSGRAAFGRKKGCPVHAALPIKKTNPMPDSELVWGELRGAFRRGYWSLQKKRPCAVPTRLRNDIAQSLSPRFHPNEYKSFVGVEARG